MVRSAAHLLVLVMLLASGRLLACGWECVDELAAPAAASCHQDAAPVTALSGAVAHACLPEVAEPRVTIAKPASAQRLVAAPMATLVNTAGRPLDVRLSRTASSLTRFASPPPPAPFVLRI